MIHSKNFDKKYFSSGSYKDYKKILDGWVRPMAKRISNLLKNKSSVKILDVGCGFGNLITELQNKYNFSVNGLDCSSYAIKKIHSSVKGKVKKGSILKIPFKKNSFDAVICFDVIYYLTLGETKKAIKNLVDVSRDYIFFNSIYRHSEGASQKHNSDHLRITVLSKKEYIDIFLQNGAGFIKKFAGENGGETLVFKKIH